MKKIYLDHNATTPVRTEVFEAMKPFLTEKWGNPSSIHWAGRMARGYVDEAREKVAFLLGADPAEIIFTSCGSESNNLAIKGTVAYHEKKGNHIITTKVEHPAVLETCRYLEKKGCKVTYLSVDRQGMIDLDEYRNAFRNDTVLVTVMMANNETGTVFPIKEMSAIAKERGVIFHTDAVQAAGKLPLDVNELGVDMLTISGHKIYAPKGIGVLYVRKGVRLDNLIHGGHQEKGRRAGTENVAGIVAIGTAAELAKKELPEVATRVKRLRDKLENGLRERISDVQVNGHPEKRVPTTLNMSFFYIEGESILLHLDMEGIAASSGSACTSGSLEPSHVLLAMNIPPENAHGSVRFSLGKDTTEEEIDYVLEVLPPIVERLRSYSPLYKRSKTG